jgi:hypothetical protein
LRVRKDQLFPKKCRTLLAYYSETRENEKFGKFRLSQGLIIFLGLIPFPFKDLQTQTHIKDTHMEKHTISDLFFINISFFNKAVEKSASSIFYNFFTKLVLN